MVIKLNKVSLSYGLIVMFLMAQTMSLWAKEKKENNERNLTVINMKYEGKIIWLPSPLVVKKGEKVTLKLINNVQDDPNIHGFFIPAFDVKADVERGTPMTVEFTAKEAGLFEIKCHLHPAHLYSQLLVIE